MNIDFALERIRGLEPDANSEEYLVEIAWLYDRVVRSGSTVPVIDLAYELVMPIDFVEARLICAPKKGSNGGLISKKALRKLKQVGNHAS